MGLLKKTIKDNIMGTENKYKYDDEKIGQVIEASETENRCTIYVITRDGISSIEYNVFVKCDKFPKVGDYVELREQLKKFTIVGIYNPDEFNTILEGDIYSGIYGGAINGYVGI